MNPENPVRKNLVELAFAFVAGMVLAFFMYSNGTPPFNNQNCNSCNCDRPSNNRNDTPHNRRNGGGSLGSTGDTTTVK